MRERERTEREDRERLHQRNLGQTSTLPVTQTDILNRRRREEDRERERVCVCERHTEDTHIHFLYTEG